MECSDDGMDCREIIDQVYEYLNGELDPAGVAVIKGHLDDCSPCLAEYGVEEAVRKLVARSCCVTAPDSLREQIRTKISEVRSSSS